MSSSHEQFPESPLPTAGINPNDTAHLEGLPYDTEPLGQHYNENYKLDTGELQQVQTREYWSPRPPAQELPGITTEAQPEKKGFSLKAKIAAGVAGLALLAGVGAGVKAMTDGASEPLHPEQTTSGPATPGQSSETKSAEKSDPSLRHDSVIQHDLYTTLTPEVKAKIDMITGLTPEQAAQLPMQDQLMFASFVRDNNEAHTRWRMETNGTKPFKDILDNVKPAEATDTGAQVLAQANMNAQIIFTLMPKGKTLDQTTAQKLTVLDISPESKGYENWNNHIQSNTGGLLKPDAVSLLAEKSFTKNGEQYLVTNLTDSNDEVGQSTHRLESYVDYAGKTRATWQTILSVGPDDPRYDPSLSQ